MPNKNVKGKVIAIYSSFPGQGKSVICQRLVKEHGFHHLPFARLIKRLAFVLLTEHGYSGNAAIRYLESEKEVHLDKIAGAPTARYLLQTLGTEWGRHIIHANLWLLEWETQARTLTDSGLNIVADDLRLPSEVEAVHRLGGRIWRVERPDAEIPESSNHETEGRLNSVSFDRLLINDGTIESLYKKVDAAVNFTRTGKLKP